MIYFAHGKTREPGGLPSFSESCYWNILLDCATRFSMENEDEKEIYILKPSGSHYFTKTAA